MIKRISVNYGSQADCQALDKYLNAGWHVVLYDTSSDPYRIMLWKPEAGERLDQYLEYLKAHARGRG